MTTYDDNNEYYLKLYNFNNNNFVWLHSPGYVNKPGRYLSLAATHHLICQRNLSSHNPVYDIELTNLLCILLPSCHGTNIIS